MPRLRVMTTTPASWKTALSWATESAFCERSMPYSFTCGRTRWLADGRLRCPCRRCSTGESVEREGGAHAKRGAGHEEAEAAALKLISPSRPEIKREAPTGGLGRMNGRRKEARRCGRASRRKTVQVKPEQAAPASDLHRGFGRRRSGGVGRGRSSGVGRSRGGGVGRHR